MNFITAIAIGLYGWMAGTGLAGQGGAWSPAPIPVRHVINAPCQMCLSEPDNLWVRSATLADPWSTGFAEPRASVAVTRAARDTPPHVVSRRPATVRPVATTPRSGTARERHPVVRESGAAHAAGRVSGTAPRRAAPAPPPGSFMTRPDYERAIALRLARAHPGLAPAVRRAIAGAIAERALAWGLDPWLVYADIHVESGFKLRAVGQAGEIGLMQVLPSTARMVARKVLGLADFPAARLYDPAWNVRIGTAYLGLMMEQRRGDVAVALAAYNAGTGVEGPTGYTDQVLSVFRRVAMARRVASPPPDRPRRGAAV